MYILPVMQAELAHSGSTDVLPAQGFYCKSDLCFKVQVLESCH